MSARCSARKIARFASYSVAQFWRSRTGAGAAKDVPTPDNHLQKQVEQDRPVREGTVGRLLPEAAAHGVIVATATGNVDVITIDRMRQFSRPQLSRFKKR